METTSVDLEKLLAIGENIARRTSIQIIEKTAIGAMLNL